MRDAFSEMKANEHDPKGMRCAAIVFFPENTWWLIDFDTVELTGASK